MDDYSVITKNIPIYCDNTSLINYIDVARNEYEA